MVLRRLPDQFDPANRWRTRTYYNPNTAVSTGGNNDLVDRKDDSVRHRRGSRPTFGKPRPTTSVGGLSPTISTRPNRVVIPIPRNPNTAISPGERDGSTDRLGLFVDPFIGFVLVPSSYPATPDQFSPVSRDGSPRVPGYCTPRAQSEFRRSVRLRIQFYRQTGFYSRRESDAYRRFSGLTTNSPGLSRRVTTYCPGLYWSAPVETLVRYPTHSMRRWRTSSASRYITLGSVPPSRGRTGNEYSPGPGAPARRGSLRTYRRLCRPDRASSLQLPIADSRGEVGPTPGSRHQLLVECSRAPLERSFSGNQLVANLVIHHRRTPPSGAR